MTGLPPFYDADINEVYRKSLSESSQVPISLSPAAQDTLAKLLTRKPEQRLGAKGVSEIKAHAFFNDIDWERLAKQEYTPPFKPKHSIMSFAEERPRSLADFWNEQLFFSNSFPHGPPDPNRVISYSTGLCPRKLTKNELLQQQFNRRVRVTSGKESHETSLEDLDLVHKSDKEPATPNKVYFKSLPTEDDIYASSSDDSRSIHAKTFIEDNDGWEIVENEGWKLVWDSADQAFYFHNHFTSAKERITASRYRYRYTRNSPPTAHQLTGDSQHNLVLSKPPTQGDKHDALEAILKAGHKHLVPQLLQEHGMDVNIYLFFPRGNSIVSCC